MQKIQNTILKIVRNNLFLNQFQYSQSNKPTQIIPFHLAFPVKELIETKHFYQNILGCEIGRTSEQWIDFNFFGHQITAHCVKNFQQPEKQTNEVDKKQVPCPHFGAILPWEEFDKVAEILQQNNVQFILEPQIRFKGLPGEQKTMFVKDPSGNTLEFKSFQNFEQIFAPQ